jgi:hypothetical protein
MISPLIWLSGADPDILRSCPYGERAKYVGLGGAVLTTSAMGALSCGFALHMAMRLPVVICVVLALAWGVAIMNLDRWLISGTQRRATAWQNLMLAAPRVLLGVLIGLVVSTPLTLRIFQDEINAELAVMQREAQDEFARKLAADERFTRIPALAASVATMQSDLDKGPDVSGDPTVARIQAEYDVIDRNYQKAAQLVICEEDGTCGTGKRGAGKSFDLKVTNRDKLENDRADKGEQLRAAQTTARGTRAGSLTQVRADLDKSRVDLAAIIAAKQGVQDEFAAAERNNHGLLARMNALSRLTDDDSTLWIAHAVLILFLTAFEVLPVLFKILLSIGSPGVYDRLRAKKDDTSYEVAADDLQGNQDLSLYENNARRVAETAAIDAFVQEVVDVQTEVAKTVLQGWRHQQLTAAQQNPAQFVVPDDPDDTLVLGPAPGPAQSFAGQMPAPRHGGTAPASNVP